MDVLLKSADELSCDDREAWQAIVKGNPLLDSPYFDLACFDAVAAARPDTRVVCFRDAGAPAAFLPMQVYRFGFARQFAGPLGDHCAIIAPEEFSVDLGESCAQAGIGVFSFDGALANQNAFEPHIAEIEGSWVIDLSQGYDVYMEHRRSLMPDTFRKIRSRLRKIEKLSPVFRLRDRRPEAFEAALAWKSAQYEQSETFDVFSVEWTRKLLNELCHSKAEDFEGIVSSLEIDGQLAAVHIGMGTQRAHHHWFPAYDHKFAKLGPGNALFLNMAEALANEGVQTIHMGAGGYHHKSQLGSWQFPIGAGFVGAGPSYKARQLYRALENGMEGGPLGRVGYWPGKARRRIKRMVDFKLV